MALIDQWNSLQDAEFVGRLRMAILSCAVDIMNESALVTHHADRVALAHDLLLPGSDIEARYIHHFVEALVAFGVSTAATDSQITTIVQNGWNRLAVAGGLG